MRSWRERVMIGALVGLASACTGRGDPPAGADGGPLGRDSGGDARDAGVDARAPADPDPQYTVVEGDCELLWRVRSPGIPFAYDDADADGRDDLGELVVTYTGEFAESRITIRAGRDGSVIRSFETPPLTGIEAPDGYGVAASVMRVEAGPDVTGDGVDDLALLTAWALAPLAPGDAVVSPGERGTAIQVVSGLDGALVWQRLYGGSEGTDVADLRWAGDAGADGVRDLVVGESREAGTGELVVLDARAGTVIARYAGPSDLEDFPGSFVVISEAPLRLAVQVQRFGEASVDGVILGLAAGTSAPVWRVEGAGELEQAGGALDVNGDGALDLLTRDRSEPTLRARNGATGEILWTVVGPAGANNWGYGLAIIADADGDGTADVAAGTLNARRAVFSMANVPGLFTVSSGGDGHVIARVAHDLERGEEPVFDNFGADIAAFDDPSARDAAAFAVSHEIIGVEHWLTGWSCRVGE